MTTVAAPRLVSNREIARRLDEVAHLLDQQVANPFRIRAYRAAAAAVRDVPDPLAERYRTEGLAGLERIPGVGERIARAIQDLLTSGRFLLLERLRGETDPVRQLTTLPGVGRALAARLHDELRVSTLEDLEVALHDGRLAALPGFGPKRLAGIAAALAQRLHRRPGPRPPPEPEPPVAELLDVDREYRERAEAGRLPLIAPRRLNPERRAWLPVLHATRGERQYTALFSNTPLAHRLGRTRDWVVLYADGGREHQYTVVTARAGSLLGRRVVRGREADCMAHYEAAPPPAPAWSRQAAPPRRAAVQGTRTAAP